MITWLIGIGGSVAIALLCAWFGYNRRQKQLWEAEREAKDSKNANQALKDTAEIFAKPSPDTWDGTVDKL